MTGVVIDTTDFGDSTQTITTTYEVVGTRVISFFVVERLRNGRPILNGRGGDVWNPGDPGYEDALARATAAIAADLSKS